MQYSFVLPYLRGTPIHIPRRDLVIGGADSVMLEIGVVESDNPSSQSLVLTGGIGGPALRMNVWPRSYVDWSWDYGRPSPGPRSVLWSGAATISATKLGTFELRIPIATAMCWPVRCTYAIQLDWDAGTLSETLAQGMLHVRRATVIAPRISVTLLTDDSIPIHTDDDIPLEA